MVHLIAGLERVRLELDAALREQQDEAQLAATAVLLANPPAVRHRIINPRG